MTALAGNSEFLFPLDRNVPLGFTSENTEGPGKQNPLFPFGPGIKCLIQYVRVFQSP